LRSAYKLPKPEVISSLKDFVGLPNVTLQEPEQVSLALDWTTKGMDFADALHLAAAQSSETFVTFDRQLASVAKLVGASPVRLL
jgi:predicted nucleic acid-binding protein